MNPLRAVAVVAAFACACAPAFADTLYVAPQDATAPGHPMRLGPDHRAQQVGDLVSVQFNFDVQSTSTNVVSNNKNYGIGVGTSSISGGSGFGILGNVKIPLQATTGSGVNQQKSGRNTFQTTMMATVVGVLPSGALQIQGTQKLFVNGQEQNLRVSGTVRPEDIDGTDTVLSTRIANVVAQFDGNFQEGQKGLIRRILDVLF